ncbi:hypothetical protein DFQ27_001235 [Actinomortierella ambigua]|uniref:CsbD family protein n=1 Tax=Actinomortierella ambigua TaxID=1343610 RepID=A0A9P6UBY5_9FUNG|nr:hypothetical protein DFQ26_004233 [Actinomortierella ambigua]KAG0269974.1 hypothetical protein DFQ27_001235 [Actinomortierella ambigua]
MTDKLTHTYNTQMGTAKEKLGTMVGNEGLAAAGAEQRTRAEAARHAALTEKKGEGAEQALQGEVERGIGRITGDDDLRQHGAAKTSEGTTKMKSADRAMGHTE